MIVQSIRARDCMTRSVVTVTPQTEILQALHTLIEKNIAGAPVVDEAGAVVGMLSERDCMEVALSATYHSEYGGVVADFMSAPAVGISPDEGIVDIVKRFITINYHRYPVVEGGQLIGLISRRDVMRALGDAWH